MHICRVLPAKQERLANTRLIEMREPYKDDAHPYGALRRLTLTGLEFAIHRRYNKKINIRE